MCRDVHNCEQMPLGHEWHSIAELGCNHPVLFYVTELFYLICLIFEPLLP